MKLVASDLVAGYRGRTVLNGIDFVAESGEVIALLGPNGCGKTTLIRCLSKQLRPTSGSIAVDGCDLTTLSYKQTARRIAVVPQFEDSVFEFTVRQIVEMGLHPWEPLLDSETRISSVLDATSLTPLAERPISQLSGGEKQRALLARALAQNTQVLLLDEPTAHMDVGFQIATLSHVRKIAHEGRTVVAALHDLNLAAGFADRSVLLFGGVVVADAPVAKVLESNEIERVYGARFDRFHDHAKGRIILAPEFVPERARVKQSKRVHLIGGGGSAAALLTELWQLGHSVTLGVAHQGDSDHASAMRLGVPVVAAPPFSAISEREVAETTRMAQVADVVVYCCPPIGPGNLANLQLAHSLAESGKRVLIWKLDTGDWDFTNGTATQALNELSSHAETFQTLDQLVAAVGGSD